mmetsp:Transcript_77252/g.238474  ORF Transcript_77252/g.238474 Transcript_77252/m.238474 type:complete len:420 (-) Transcript_77252:382-1641(-)
MPRSTYSLLLGGDVPGPLAGDDDLATPDLLPASQRNELALLLQADLLLRLRHAAEDLAHPSGSPRIEKVLDGKLDPLAVHPSAVRPLSLLQIQQAPRHLDERLLARWHGLECMPDGHQQLHCALDHVLLGHPRCVVAEGELLNHRADDASGEQLPQEEVPDELHVCQHSVLPPLPPELELLGVVPLQVLVHRREGRRQGLKLVLAYVEEHGLEGQRLAPVRAGELREGGPQRKDEVSVGLAVVRLGDRLLEDQGDDVLQLLGALDLHLANLLGNGRDALGADFVQQALNCAPQLLHARHNSAAVQAVGLWGWPWQRLVVSHLAMSGLRRQPHSRCHKTPQLLRRRRAQHADPEGEEAAAGVLGLRRGRRLRRLGICCRAAAGTAAVAAGAAGAAVAAVLLVASVHALRVRLGALKRLLA